MNKASQWARLISSIIPTQKDFVELQDQIEPITKELSTISLLYGVLHSNLIFDGTSTLKITHKLGKKWKGYIITKQNFADVVYTTTANNPNNTADIFIYLDCNTSGTADIWIF